MSALFAWSLYDSRDRIRVLCLLTGPYFAVATQWPTEEASWYTRDFGSPEAARAYAISHAALLEENGDDWMDGPTVVEVKDQSDALGRLTGQDVPSATLDYLFSCALDGGKP